jgi:hypothetical protein
MKPNTLEASFSFHFFQTSIHPQLFSLLQTQSLNPPSIDSSILIIDSPLIPKSNIDRFIQTQYQFVYKSFYETLPFVPNPGMGSPTYMEGSFFHHHHRFILSPRFGLFKQALTRFSVTLSIVDCRLADSSFTKGNFLS